MRALRAARGPRLVTPDRLPLVTRILAGFQPGNKTMLDLLRIFEPADDVAHQRAPARTRAHGVIRRSSRIRIPFFARIVTSWMGAIS